MSDTVTSNSNNNLFFSDSEVDDRERSELDIDMHITPTLLSQIMENIEDFCNIYNESKYIRVVNYKTITLIIQKLEKIHIDL